MSQTLPPKLNTSNMALQTLYKSLNILIMPKFNISTLQHTVNIVNTVTLAHCYVIIYVVKVQIDLIAIIKKEYIINKSL